MASLATETWWSTFLDAHGRDSEEEAAFNGFLTTNGIPAGSGPDVLQEAYTHFVQFMAESEQRQADLGPSRAERAAAAAVAEVERQFVAKSRVSAPGMEKPLVAATRPAVSREPLDAQGAGPGGEAHLASAASGATTPPRSPTPLQGTAGTTPPESPATPPPPAMAPGDPQTSPGARSASGDETEEPPPQPGLRRR